MTNINTTMTGTLFGNAASALSDRELRMLLASYARFSHEFMIWRDDNGTNKFVSRSCQRLTGHTPDNFLTNSAFLEKIIHYEDLPMWREQHADGHIHKPIHVRLQSSNGDYIWFEHTCCAVDNDSGFNGVIGYFVDINAIKHAQAIHSKLTLAIDQSDNGFAILDKNGIIEYANTAFLDLQVDDSIDIGTPLPLLAPGSARIKEIVDELLKGRIWHEHFSIELPSGATLWQSIKISPIYDNNRHISHYMVFLIDITQKTRNRDKMQQLFAMVEQSKQEWERSLDCISDVVILADNNGVVRRINKAVGTMFDTDMDEILGKHWNELLPPEMRQLDNLPEEHEFHDEKRDRWFYYHIFTFDGDDLASKVKQVVTIHETTNTWRITRELADAYEHLKATQGQLLHQEKMASIGQLAAGVAHEINNPTGFITSNLSSLGKYIGKLADYITLLEQSLQDCGNDDLRTKVQQQRKKMKIDFVLEDIDDLIAESLEGTQRVKTIVQNLKSFSRVDDTGFSVTNLHECLEAALSIAWNEIKYKATVNKDFQPIPEIYCSPQQLNQVFLNLLVNAAQAIEDSGEITVATATSEPWVVITISDTGKGIKPEHLNRVFEPFFTTKEVGKGTGLGLSICYDIIKKHHGDIFVASKPGKGTTFTIKLPIEAPQQQDKS